MTCGDCVNSAAWTKLLGNEHPGTRENYAIYDRLMHPSTSERRAIIERIGADLGQFGC